MNKKLIIAFLGILSIFLLFAINTNKEKQYSVSILEIAYIPLNEANNDLIDLNIVGPYLKQETTVQEIRQRIKTISNKLILDLEEGGSYLKYKDPNSKPIIDYNIIESKEFLRPILRTDNPEWIFNENTDWGMTADHLNELKNIDICEYIDNKGVKEVWIWMYHNALSLDENRYYVSPTESNMASSYGDISNSYRIDDLPICKNTYTVYEYNYTRGAGEALENHTHQIEALLEHYENESWNNFIGGDSEPFGCGWTHCPPNVMSDCINHNYDWRNETIVASYCGGENININCHTWSGDNCNDYDGEKFKVWWMQNISKEWWRYIADFDSVAKK